MFSAGVQTTVQSHQWTESDFPWFSVHGLNATLLNFEGNFTTLNKQDLLFKYVLLLNAPSSSNYLIWSE